MTPEFPKSQREELEMRITALLMGELSAEEAGSLREAIARDPELAALESQLKLTIGLLKETAAESAEGLVSAEQAPRLSDARREKLLATFKGRSAISRKRPVAVDWRTWGALAAMVTGLLAVAALMFKQPSRYADSVQLADFDSDTTRFYSYSANPKPEATQLPPGGTPSSESESLVRRNRTMVERRPSSGANDSPPAPVDEKANKTLDLAAAVQDPNGRAVYLPSEPSKSEDTPKSSVDYIDQSGRISTRAGLATSGKKEPQNTFGERPAQTINRAAVGGEIATDSFGLQPLQEGGYVQLQNGLSQGQKAGKLDQQARMDPSTELASKPASASGGSEVMDLRRKEGDLSSVVTPGQSIAQAGAHTSGPAPATTPPVVNESLAYDATPALTPSPANIPAPAANPSAGVPIVNAPPPAARPERRNLAQTEKQVALNVDSVQTVPTSDFGNVADGTVATLSVDGLGTITTNSFAANYSSFGRTLGEGQVLSWDMQTANGLDGRSGAVGGGGFGGAANWWKEQSPSLSRAKKAEDERMMAGKSGRIVLPELTDSETGQMIASGPKKPALQAGDRLEENISQKAKESQSERSLERMSEVRKEAVLEETPAPLQAKSLDDLLKAQVPDESGAIASGKDKQLKELELRLADKIDSNVPETEEAKQLGGDAGRVKESKSIRIQNKLDTIRLEKLSADGVPLTEVVKQLSDEIRKQDPERKGINLVIAPPISDKSLPIQPATGLPLEGMAGIDAGSATVQLNLTNVTVREALEKISKAADRPVQFRVEEYAVILTPADEKKQLQAPTQQSAPALLVPQPEVSTAANPFSTFSLNVSDVSFKLAAASLEKGVMPEAASVRSEEFINAFDYHDPAPGGSAPIAFNWERSRYPFAHGRDLLRFSIKTAASGRAAGQPLNLVLLLDNSGSMERADRVRIRMECLRVLGAQLQPQDRVSVVAFARTPRLWVDGLPGNQAGDLPQRVGTLAPEGGTNLEEAMNLAYQTALRHYQPHGANRVVLLTDGAANLGEVKPESLKQKVEAHRQQGVALDCFGIGWEGYNDDLLEVLSRNGDGRYGFVNSPEAAKTEFANQLAGALQVAASDVKVQVEFNPKRTTAYRQIGYAKHQLTKEQFRDNTVDAAEIGAAEAGNALYVVQVNPQGEGPIATVRARFKVPGTTDYREHEWVVPYTGEAKELERSNAPMRLAAVASAFSEWLAASPYAGEVTTDQLLRLLSGVPETFGSDPRPKKLEWMIRQAKSVSGK